MSLASKGSRRIVVEGTAYRWVVRPGPTYSQALTWRPLSFAVELENAGQSILAVTLDATRPDNWLGEKGFVVTPSLVAHAIRQAVEQGWKPQSKGSPHKLVLSVAEGGVGSGNTTSGTSTRAA